MVPIDFGEPGQLACGAGAGHVQQLPLVFPSVSRVKFPEPLAGEPGLSVDGLLFPV
jgi:hypothetical protein